MRCALVNGWKAAGVSTALLVEDMSNLGLTFLKGGGES